MVWTLLYQLLDLSKCGKLRELPAGVPRCLIISAAPHIHQPSCAEARICGARRILPPPGSPQQKAEVLLIAFASPDTYSHQKQWLSDILLPACSLSASTTTFSRLSLSLSTFHFSRLAAYFALMSGSVTLANGDQVKVNGKPLSCNLIQNINIMI
jgi:hypothetical protein